MLKKCSRDVARTRFSVPIWNRRPILRIVDYGKILRDLEFTILLFYGNRLKTINNDLQSNNQVVSNNEEITDSIVVQ